MKTIKIILGSLFVLLLIAALGGVGFFLYRVLPLSSVAKNRTINANVPALVYHEIAATSNSDWVLPVETFKQQMAYLKEQGYAAITVEQFYVHLKDNIPFEPKTVLITFDDAWKGQYRFAFPILKENRLAATFYLPVRNVDKGRPVDPYGEIMSWQEIKEMQDQHFDFESHTLKHYDLCRIPWQKVWKEMWLSRWLLQKRLKKSVEHLSYPHGSYDEKVEFFALLAGYKSAALTKKRAKKNRPYFLRIKRKEIKARTSFEEFQAMLRDTTYFDPFR